MKLTTYRWVQAFMEQEKMDVEQVKNSFNASSSYRKLLVAHIDKELLSIDKSSSLQELADKPSRGEFLLAMQAKRETLNNLKQYLIDNI